MVVYQWQGTEYVPTSTEQLDDDFSSGWRIRCWPLQPNNALLHQHLNQLAPAPLMIMANEFGVDIYVAGMTEQEIQSWTANLSDVPFNYAVQSTNESRVKPELLVFDMDSTLIQMECIDELARRCGFYDKVAAITESAMRGELDFAQSLRKRVALLKELPVSVIDDLAADLPFTQGVQAMAKWARQQGIHLAVVSGGFVPFVEALKRQLHFDFAHANTLEQKEGQLTGEVSGIIVDGERKKELLIEMREQLSLPAAAVWAIGDGANDLPMMHEAGLGIAFDAKPKVKAQAMAAIHQPDMLLLLQLLQFDESH